MRTNLVIDVDSIVLKAIRDYYAKSKRLEIIRSKLLDLTGPIGNKMAPATFDRCLKRLQKIHLLHCNKIGRNTVIVYDINMVNSTLRKKNQALYLMFQSLTEEILPETWESIFENIVSGNLMQDSIKSKRRASNSVSEKSIITNAYSAMWGIIMSRSLELFILQDSWSKMKQKRQDAVVELIKAATRFIDGNPDEPFTITIEFNGFNKTRLKAGNELYPQIIQKISPHLILFSERIMKHKISKRDQFYLRHSVLHCLSSRSRKCVDTFMDKIDEMSAKLI